MKKTWLTRGWKLGHFDPGTKGALKNPPQVWKAVTVPGSVQTSAFGLPRQELYRGTRVRDVQWMQERMWVYRCSFAVPKAGRDETVRLVFAGIEYAYDVRINGKTRANDEGMFRAVVIPLDDLQGKRVEVEVRLAPPAPTRDGHLETTKAQFSRGWDFAPELRTVGVWDEVWVEIAPKLRVEDAFIETRLQNTQRALVTVHAELSEKVVSGWANISLCGAKRRVPLLGADRFTAFIEIESPELWWPNGLGKAALHDLVIRIEVAGRTTEKFTQKVGLRDVARVPAQGQRPTDIPLQFTINGLPFFINGMNWVPPDACVGEITASQYERPLKAFQAGGVNLVRVWGGGLREKRPFYDLCDKLGLLVFQEYPIACGIGTSEAYFRQLQIEARHIARALRRHPSLLVFSGGNENYHYWHMLDSDDPSLADALNFAVKAGVIPGRDKINRDWIGGMAKRYDEPVHLILGGVTADEAPHCLYQNTSAMEDEGEVHGTWTWNPRIGDHRYRGHDTIYDYWRAADQHLYSESSVSSIANRETIRDVTGVRTDRLPDFEDPTWRLHHAFYGAWDKHRDLWLDLPSTEEIFGPITSLDELIVLNHYLQGEGGRFMIEELRRKQPTAAGLIWWGANEPWPGLAGNALIDYYGRAKLSWPMITNAFSPVIISLRYEAIQPRPLRGELWLSCNRPGGFAGRYEAVVADAKGVVLDRYTGACRIDYLQSTPLRRLTHVPIAEGAHVSVKTRLFDASGKRVHENLYLFGNIRKVVLSKFRGKSS
jgi:beta-mannosidase